MTAVHGALAPHARADLIYAQARAGIDARLWRAALGSEAEPTARANPAVTRAPVTMDALLTMLSQRPASPRPADIRATDVRPAVVNFVIGADAEVAAAPKLGVNDRFAATIDAAAARTGIPSSALAAILNAESAKDSSGQWQTASRNPRSTAVGLGQFLAGTWQSEAQSAGTWLNGVARANGWLGDDGRILSGARGALLALRQNADASINATADYSRRNLDALRQAGIGIGEGVEQIAQAAYLSHNLGVRDAVNFMRGGIGEARAKMLLEAQVGVGRAAQRIAEAGGAIIAHRDWLTGFIERHIRPDRFRA